MASIWPRTVIESNSDRRAASSGRSLIPRDNELPFRGNLQTPRCREFIPSITLSISLSEIGAAVLFENRRNSKKYQTRELNPKIPLKIQETASLPSCRVKKRKKKKNTSLRILKNHPAVSPCYGSFSKGAEVKNRGRNPAWTVWVSVYAKRA